MKLKINFLLLFIWTIVILIVNIYFIDDIKNNLWLLKIFTLSKVLSGIYIFWNIFTEISKKRNV